MIKKIPMTASTMLFALTQIFSFYVILTSRQQKIDLVQKQQGSIFSQGISNIDSDLLKMNYQSSMQDYVVTYCFRNNMPEGAALYKEDKELYNSTPYDFDSSQINLKQEEYPFLVKQEKIGDAYLLVFYIDQWIRKSGQKQEKYVYCRGNHLYF